jgi:hypothetical protein
MLSKEVTMGERIRIERAPRALLDGSRGPRSPYAVALNRLEVGQSFVAPLEKRATISAMAWWYGERLKRKFQTRKVDGKLYVIRAA